MDAWHRRVSISAALVFPGEYQHRHNDAGNSRLPERRGNVLCPVYLFVCLLCIVCIVSARALTCLWIHVVYMHMEAGS